MVVAQAQKIDVPPATASTFTFSANQRTLARSFEQNRAGSNRLPSRWPDARSPSPRQADAAAAAPNRPPRAAEEQRPNKKSALREQALADAGVQTMLEVFPAEIRDVEEMCMTFSR